MRTHFKTVLIAVVTFALLAWFFRQANIGEVWREIRSARTWALAMSLVMTGLTYAFRASRWQYLLQPIGTVRFQYAFRATVIGFAANAVLPARIGEVVRPYLLARHERLPVTATFATIILERLLDLITVLLLFGLFVLIFDPAASPVDPSVYRTVKGGGLLAAVGSVLALVMMAVIARHQAQVETSVARAARVLPPAMAEKLARLAHTFAEGLAITRDPRRLFMAVLLSFPLWLSIALMIWFVTLAFHMTIPFLGSFLLLALLAVGVAVPTPGAVGGFHETFRIGVTAFYGIANDRAVGAAIVLHAISIVPVTLAGAWFMFREGLNLSRMKRLSEEAQGIEPQSPPGQPGDDAVARRRSEALSDEWKAKEGGTLS